MYCVSLLASLISTQQRRHGLTASFEITHAVAVCSLWPKLNKLKLQPDVKGSVIINKL